MAEIKVIGKGNFGVHPVYGEIVKGRKYTIDENDFGSELFELATTKPAGSAETKKARE